MPYVAWVLRSPLARDSSAAFLIRVIWAATAFLAQLVAARVLGVDGFGVYAYVLAWISVLPLLAAFGLDNTVLRFASAYRAREEWGLLRGVARYSERCVCFAGLFVVVIGWGILAILGERLPLTLAKASAVGLVAVPVLALIWLRVALLRGLGHTVAALVPADLLRNAFVLAALAILAMAMPGSLGPVRALALTLLGALLSLATLSLVLHRVRPEQMRRAVVAEERAKWRATALPFLLLAGSQMILTRTDILMLGWLMDTTAAGIYTAAVRLADLTVFALAAINVAAAPPIAAAYARRDEQRLQATATWSARTALVFALTTALPLAVFASPLLALFGRPFVVGASALQLLLLGQLVNAATGSVGSLLTMTGHERRAIHIIAFSVVANAGLNFLLVPILGIPGAALATMLTVAGYNLALMIAVSRRVGVAPGLSIGLLNKLRGAPSTIAPHRPPAGEDCRRALPTRSR